MIMNIMNIMIVCPRAVEGLVILPATPHNVHLAHPDRVNYKSHNYT
jgi:hypothetical protein